MSTARDKAILNTILNPFLPSGAFDTEDDEGILNDDVGAVTTEVVEAKRLEREAIALAEAGKVRDAIKVLDRAVETAPHLPSLYNNRAQAYRLVDDTDRALDDLNHALSMTDGSGRTARQAFCQRALILKRNGDEEKAMEDFRSAAKLGNPFAKMVLVQANPYAALCNDMLSQLMEKLVQGPTPDPGNPA